ncbi:Protein kinase-like domain [Pseudocohnilembus persalinus]|uniref:Aurora kinase n=1 Tax=Pseudocohnilembus persalinus TaxID=266149 RepID=A0A0V0QJR7_PSEPJ|nr:Protein kinase-like domain [Pseudocohnilembus persalinus]|eukprot:KRX02465.1 Protein kinase-like domain [Pseudocohnilembus persalinus]
MEEQIIQEIKIQMFCDHPNILNMYSYFDDKTNIYLVLDYIPEGDLFNHLQKQKLFQEEQAKFYIYQICLALNYLHENNIIHRDIKPENIMVQNNMLKLSDFGWSIYTEQSRNTFCGTLDYISPEIVNGQKYDSSIDLWSVGVLTYELITGKPPFVGCRTQSQICKKINNAKITYPQHVSQQAQSFINQFLVKDPKKRIPIKIALQHPWLYQINQNLKKEYQTYSQEIQQFFNK